MALTAPSLPGPIDPQLPQVYKRLRLQAFDGGVRESAQPEQINPNELVQVKNLFWYDGQLLVDTGYSPFGPNVDGSPHVPFQIFYPNGTTQLLLVTTSTMYVLSSGSPPQWQYVPYAGPATALTNAVAAAATNFAVTNSSIFFAGGSITILLLNGLTYTTTVDHIAGSIVYITGSVPAPGANPRGYVVVHYLPPILTAAVAAGDTIFTPSNLQGIKTGSKLGVELIDGNQWQFTASVSGGTITADVPCPAVGAANGASIALAVKFNGSLTVQPVITAFPGHGWVILSNGFDPIFYYDGARIAQLPGLPDNTSAQAMAVFHGSLHIANLVENGQEFPQRDRMSDAGDPTGWIPGQNGIAAIYNLVDTEDFILSLNLLGPWLIAYRETTIMRASYLGLPLNTIFWEYMVFGGGIESEGSVAEIGETHAIVGTQGVYEYAGGYDLVSIGDNIFSQLLSAKGNLNAEAKSTIFTQYVSDQDEFWLFYPTGENTLPDTMLRCSLEKKAWYPRVFKDAPFVSAGFFLPLLTTTWSSAIGTWAQNTAAWNSRIFLVNAPTVILCSPNADRTFVYDYNTPGDNGSAAEWSMTLKDLGDGDSLMRWDSMVLYGKGNGITVSYALDPPRDPLQPGPPVVFTPLTDADGNVYTLDFGDGASRQRITFNNVSTYIRIMLNGTDPTFTLSYAEMWYAFETEY